MKSIFRTSVIVLCFLYSINAQAQKADSVKRNSIDDLIEMENRKNLIPNTKDNPPAFIQTKNNTHIISEKPKQVLRKSRKKKKS